MSVSPEQFSNATVNAKQRLTDRRKARYDEAFRADLLDEVGDIAIANEVFHPADVLEQMAEETFRIAKSEAIQDYRVQFTETVIDAFPAPIAWAYNSFLRGSTNQLARVGFMRDTWEAAVAICYALVITEAAAIGAKLHEVLMRDGPNNAPRRLKNRDLRSDGIAARLGVIEGILVFADVNNVQMASREIIPIEVVGEMRILNDIRNGFSHAQTMSESQAKKIIEDSEQDLLDVLLDLGELASLEVFRVHQIATAHPNTLVVEPLCGITMARQVRNEAVTPDVVAKCAAISFAGEFDPVLFARNGKAFFASPYLYCGNDASGHHTRVLMFKRQQNGVVRFEVSAHSELVEFPASRIEPEMNRVLAMMTP